MTNMAALLAEVSSQAYQEVDVFAGWLPGVGGAGLKFFEQGETQAYGFETATDRVLVFRGTEPTRLKDWKTDANVNKLVLGEGGCVHQGFADALELVWAPVAQWAAEGGGKALWVTGHSLGGALALLAGARLGGVHVYTYGQPRVGDQIFAVQAEAKLGERYCRFVHNRDIVARVPPFTIGFRHFGREMLIQNGKAVEVDFGLESVEDAVRQIVGQEVRIPKIVEGMLESILRIVESSAQPAQLAPAIAFVSEIQKRFGWLGGETLQIFVDRLVGYMKAQPRAGGGPVIGPVDDHDMRHYIAGLKAS